MKPTSLLIAAMLFLPSLASAENYYAITKAYNELTGVLSVTIAKTSKRRDCDNLLKGAVKGFSNSGQQLKIRKSTCTGSVSGDYQKAFRGESIEDVMYVSYENVIWPCVTIMYGIDKSWLNKRGCEFLASQYQHIDKNAQCVFGS
ncbi:hypothetical protein [Nitrosococcus wardiae]|uniref:Uncharacterized protein n=1 Tax=Nitrosococcus wardiae TaxID=1814290 RepID=A0A4P7BY60_9GAMM|nr:hypothetical protein [Nitrosococcus wardiae]QBQ53382.1 hypothetical protein E3U44_01820 [Nitrosococcus wardiae]